jgi:hypothetical protein
MAKEVDSMKEETISALSILEPAKANGGLPPITVGNPNAVADLAIDQSHLEEFANLASESAVVECRRPARGVFFTVKREAKKPWEDRAFYFVLQMEGRDPYLVAPPIAKQKTEEDVIRPVLLVRYVTMAGEEGLWPLKLNEPDGRSNAYNTSALNILEIAEGGKWVRIVSAKKHYRHQVSKKHFDQVPPKFTDRPFKDLVDLAFKDRIVISTDHEIWDILENGSDK